MNEEYFVNLTQEQTDEYLKRINAQRSNKLDKEYLDSLVLAHQCYVPFENTDLYIYKKPINIATENLYDKIVVRKRGGYCFELNGLFVKLLQALGFNAYSCPCRVCMEGAINPGAIMHRGNMIVIDNKYYFCDVGFGGPMPSGSIEMDKEGKQIINGETFWIEKENEFWYLLKRISKGSSEAIAFGNPENFVNIRETDVLKISKVNYEPVDFISLNNTCSVGEDVFFARSLMANLRRPNGYVSIMGNTFTKVVDGVRTREEVTEKQALEILSSEFGL